MIDPQTTDKQQSSARSNSADTPVDPACAGTARVSAQSPETLPASRASGAPHAWVGRTLGRYQVVGVLGQGGMGLVLKAYDPGIERNVAIKILRAELAANPTTLHRFLSEAKAAGRLSHANVAAVHEIGQDGDVHYLVMEFLAGGSVSAGLEQRACYSVLEATRIMIDACQGVAVAHAAGLVHRDLKPANLLIAADHTVKVTDFGLAKASAATGSEVTQLTQAGMVLGTPYFMSPEQCQAQPVDARSDVYSLGATYYCLLTGREPYHETDSVMQVMYAHCHQDVPNPRTVNPAIPQACTEIVARAMAKSPEDRYQSAEELLADLHAVSATLSGEARILLPSQSGMVHAAVGSVQPRTTNTSLRRLVGYGFGSVLVLVIAAVLAWRPWRQPDSESPAAAAAVSPAQGEPIKVGVLHSLSGTMAASESAVVEAILLAIEELNQSGGLLGRPIEAVVADGRSDWPTFAREAERLIVEERVCVVFGCWTSASRKTVKPIFEEHDHLLIYPLQYEGLETSPNIVYMGAAPNQQIIPAIRWAMAELKKRRFFLVGSDYVFPRAAHEIIKDQLRRLGGEVVGEAYLPLGEQQVDGLIAAIQTAQPEMILSTINGDSNIGFFRGLRAAGVTPASVPCLSFSIGEQELRGLNMEDVAGNYAAWTYFQSLPTPENRAFVQKFQKKYPQRVMTDPMEAAYVGVKLWAQAVGEAQVCEPKQVRRALLNARMAAPDGAVRIDPDTQHCFKTPRVGRIMADGQFEIVWSAPEPIRPEPYPDSRTAAEWRAMLHDLYTGWGNQWAAPSND